ncbi:MAG: hypothetical protein V4530_05885 [Pseudomonadota bacterium]
MIRLILWLFGKPRPAKPLSADAYVILKDGCYYRPNAAGYTTELAKAGRYTLAEAIAHSHPNGPDGPRDGISYEWDTRIGDERGVSGTGTSLQPDWKRDFEAMEHRARELSKVIVQHLGGGSEWFSRVGDEFYADPEIIRAELQRRKSDAFITKRALFRERQERRKDNI